ncbi:GTP binding protein 5 [Trichuris trichiura]|uniref:GTP binding protein 5 n=1 Tax=Trichuris trichiura TaxID=36087 RepID=A0A077ZCN8_TRITR|nr:GTP binding protein 5 [Trichuris trichiura]
MVAFLRLWCNSRAGPAGGDGGSGGHVIFIASAGARSLARIPNVVRATPGEHGGSKSCFGANAPHTYIESEGAVFVAARGGAGGHGNQFYATSSWQNPMVAEAGGSGEDVEYAVELRLMAHAGLVGLPNAGKSSLLRCLSRARPKVGPYIFTTTRPHIGVLQYADGKQLAVADLPGILAGAHRNYGLGLQFLRHVKRCVCLLFVIDASSRQPLAEQFNCLKEEIRFYDQSLLEQPRLVIANKIDIEHASDRVKQLKSTLGNSELLLPVSALHQEGINELAMELRKLLDSQCL